MKYRKLLTGILILAFLVCLLCGCQSTQRYTPPIPEEELRDLKAAYIQKFGTEISWYNEKNQMGLTVYCGSDNGYVILVEKATQGSSGSGGQKNNTTLALVGSTPRKVFDEDIVFEPVYDSTKFYAYKDGVFADLKDVYKEGLISKEVMIEATKIWRNATTTRWAD